MGKKDEGGFGKGFLVAGLAAAGVAAGYFLYGPEGKKNRKKVKAWAVKAKGEVLEEIEKMKEVSEEGYTAAVDKVANKYGKLKKVGETEAEAFSKELKKHWKNVKKELEADAKKAKKTAKKVVKKAKQTQKKAQKTIKKATKTTAKKAKKVKKALS